MPKLSFIQNIHVDDTGALPLNRIAIDPIANVRAEDLEGTDANSELGASILENGLVEPLVVRPPANGDGKYRLIAGRRRFRAAITVGLETAPVRVMDVNDDRARRIAWEENWRRKSFSPVDLGRFFEQTAILKRWDDAGCWMKVAAYCGVSSATVREHVKLVRYLASYPEILAKVHSGELSAGSGMALAKAEREKPGSAPVQLAEAEQKAKAEIEATHPLAVVVGTGDSTPPVENAACEPAQGKNGGHTERAGRKLKVKTRHVAEKGKRPSPDAVIEVFSGLLASRDDLRPGPAFRNFIRACIEYFEGRGVRALIESAWLELWNGDDRIASKSTRSTRELKDRAARYLPGGTVRKSHKYKSKPLVKRKGR